MSTALRIPALVVAAFASAGAAWKLFALLTSGAARVSAVDMALLGAFLVVAIVGGGAATGRPRTAAIVGGAVALGFAVAAMMLVDRQREAAIDDIFTQSAPAAERTPA